MYVSFLISVLALWAIYCQIVEGDLKDTKLQEVLQQERARGEGSWTVPLKKGLDVYSQATIDIRESP